MGAALVGEEARTYLGSLGVEATDAWTLFKLIDTDKTGIIDMEEFITGCMGLRGGAKAAHLAAMSYDIGMMMDGLERFIASVDGRLLALRRLLMKDHAGIDDPF